jgi:hypothetical protein
MVARIATEQGPLEEVFEYEFEYEFVRCPVALQGGGGLQLGEGW